jgi:hypothetical protein
LEDWKTRTWIEKKLNSSFFSPNNHRPDQSQQKKSIKKIKEQAIRKFEQVYSVQCVDQQCRKVEDHTWTELDGGLNEVVRRSDLSKCAREEKAKDT